VPRRLVALCLAVVAFLVSAAAASAADAPKPAEAAKAAGVEQLPADATTHHTITLNGAELHYTATAGTLPLRNDKGEEEAQIFYVAFTLDGVADESARPITYAFNGGPGAASAYLDIGALGPRALDFGADGAIPPASTRVADNPDTWLPFTDLVFVDPVGAGYSRAVGGNEDTAKRYWNVREDIAALARIIRLHATRADRLASPLYLAGESYGGFRAARLAHHLATKEGIELAGVVMISPVIDFQLMGDDQTDILPWALRLPSYAAAKLAAKGPIDPAALAPAERYALGAYLPALASGTTDPEGEGKMWQEVARLTGLDPDAIARWHGRIPLEAYVKDLHKADARIVSRYDAAVAAPDPDPWGFDVEDDPILAGTLAPFTEAFVGYVRDELEFKTDLPFALLSSEVNRHWTWHEDNGWSAPGASEALRRALVLEPHLRVLIAHGMTDLQTPYMMSRFIVDQFPPAARQRVTLSLYDGGHMMYLRAGSRRKLAADARAFYGAKGQ
jgi:carboxypeptidase C (cathepsin A)